MRSQRVIYDFHLEIAWLRWFIQTQSEAKQSILVLNTAYPVAGLALQPREDGYKIITCFFHFATNSKLKVIFVSDGLAASELIVSAPL